MIGRVKGPNVSFPVLDRHALHVVAWRSDWAGRQVIRFIESVLGIAAQAILIAILMA
jgi:hypothetical protein